MVKVITPPEVEPVTVADFTAWMQGLTVTDDQTAQVQSLLKAGREEAEAYQNAAYCEQTLQAEFEIDDFLRQPHGHPIFLLPRPPFRALQNVSAVMPDGTQQDVTAQCAVNAVVWPAELALAPGAALPVSLLVTYTAGYDAGAVPEQVRQAILLYATWGWMHRGGDTSVPDAFYALLGKGRVVPV